MSTYSTNLGLTLQTTGENPGTWGDVTNTNLGTFVEQAVTGYQTLTFASADITLTLVDGSSATTGNNYARNMYFLCNGTLGAARNLIVPNRKKLYIIRHAADNFSLTIKMSTGTGITIPQNTTTIVYCDGTNVVSAMDYFPVFSAASITNTPISATTLSASSTVSGAGFNTFVANYLAAPGTIGGTTPGSAAFTTLTANTSTTTPYVVVNGTTVPAAGIYAPSSTVLGFASATTARGSVSATGAWTLATPSASTITLTVNGVSGTHSTKIADAATALFNAGYLETPINGQTASYTAVLADSGKTIYFTGAAAATATSCSSAAGVLTVGGTITGTFAVGQPIIITSGTGTLLANTYIQSLGTGTGGAGTYNLSSTPSVALSAAAISAGAVITLPANGSVAYPNGTAITVVNDGSVASLPIGIAINTDTMYLVGTGATGTKVLSRYGQATALKLASTRWSIGGNGVA